MAANDLWDFLFENEPPIPIATGAAARGFAYTLNDDGSINPERHKEWALAKHRYQSEWIEWTSYWREMGKALHGGEDGDSKGVYDGR